MTREDSAAKLYARFRLMIDTDGLDPATVELAARQIDEMPDMSEASRLAQLIAWVNFLGEMRRLQRAA